MAYREQIPHPSEDELTITERDIHFECPHCSNILVVDRDGIGLSLNCPFCGASVVVPTESTNAAEVKEVQSSASVESLPAKPAASHYDFSSEDESALALREQELRRRLKENQSQRVELQGYINKATMDLHRFQLKQRGILERQKEFEDELKALLEHRAPG